MKVLQISSSRFESSAYSSLFGELEKRIVQDCIVPWPLFEPIPTKIPDDIYIVKSKLNFLYGQYFLKNFISSRCIYDYFKKQNKKYDLIHSHYVFYDGEIAYKINKLTNIPYVVSFRNSDLAFFRRVDMRKYGKKILKNASKIIFISQAHYDCFLDEFVNDIEKINFVKKAVVIPNGLDPYWFDNIFEKKNKVLNHPINILTVGWIQKNKNQLNVAKAIDLLSKKYDFKIIYNVIGDVRDKKYYNKLIKYRFVKHVPAIRKKSELLNEYRKADIFVMPSYNETFGLVFLEALTQSLPIIHTKRQGIDGLFSNINHIISVNPNDYQEISKSMKFLVDEYNRLDLDDLSFLDQFKWDAVANKYYDTYLQALNYEFNN